MDSDSESSLLHTSMSLLSKMIDFAKPFHVTLLGISVSDFVTSHKNGIQAYFGEKSVTQKSVTQTAKSPDETMTAAQSTSSHEPPKRCSMFTTNSGDSKIFSGSKRKSEHLESESTQPRNLPSGWDEEVFNSLPAEMQQELLATSSNQATPISQAKKKPKSSGNSILNYFGKKWKSSKYVIY